MAAAKTASVTAEPPPPPFPAVTGATERALAEAAASGTLDLAGRRLRAFPLAAAERWDLSDVTEADLSRNRLAALPACPLPALEGLSLAHNCLRGAAPALGHLRALRHLDVSHNQLTSLPPSLCLLPLLILNASSNRLSHLPEALGALGALRQLDLSCNRLRRLPRSIGRLRRLRDLDLRRNQLTALPDELAELPLVRLDFSGNRVTAVPGAFRRLRQLQELRLDNNPLQSPPAQLCLKGLVHIFKYLQHEAEGPPHASPTRFPQDLAPPEGVDSGDSGSEAPPELPLPPACPPQLALQPRPQGGVTLCYWLLLALLLLAAYRSLGGG